MKYLYRFKTESEMITEFGKDWRNGRQFGYVGWGTPGMDYLLGTVLEYDFNGFRIHIPRSTNEPQFSDEWIIVPNMLTKIESPKPNYKPKRKRKSN